MRHERWPRLCVGDTVRAWRPHRSRSEPSARIRGTVALGGVAGLTARVIACWFGSLGLVNVLAGLRHPSFDPNIWWVDLRFLPKAGGQLLLASTGVLLLAHGLRPVIGGRRRTASLTAVGIVGIIAAMNAAAYYWIWDAGTIEPRSPVPLSLLIALLLSSIWISMLRPSPPVTRGHLPNGPRGREPRLRDRSPAPADGLLRHDGLSTPRRRDRGLRRSREETTAPPRSRSPTG